MSEPMWEDLKRIRARIAELGQIVGSPGATEGDRRRAEEEILRLGKIARRLEKHLNQ